MGIPFWPTAKTESEPETDKEGDAAFFSLHTAANPSFGKYTISGLVESSTEYFVEYGQVLPEPASLDDPIMIVA